MALVTLKEIDLAFGGPLVFDKLNLNIEPGERIALLGRNGAGKTTLMRVIAEETAVDRGEVIFQKNIKVAYLPQDASLDIKGSVFDVVASSLGSHAKLLTRYHNVTHRLHSEHTPELLNQLEALQKELDCAGAWDTSNRVEEAISHMKLDGDWDFEKISGGQKRRTLLARALVLKPDLLLLDEPTNHLDIEAIDWLEEFLKKYIGSVFFITHDRMFMRHLATRVIELDRGRITSWPCDYRVFLERKALSEQIETARQDKFDKKLAQEEEWIRQGIKARRCRDEGRVNALKKLREEKRNERKKDGEVNFTHQKADISGHLVAKVMHISFGYGEKYLIDGFTTRIMRGDRIGVIGQNGSGKTSLLKLLLGKLEPTRGKVRLGTNLEIAYFDQFREQLDDEKSVIYNISGGAETVTIDGKPRNVIGYLQDFLFAPERARGPVKVLSGGERNRLLLARLFTKPSNLLVMDEPTNDLDIETLELLEELLINYSGTLILVSHDREFLNNVVTSTIVLNGEGAVNEYPGGYDDYLEQSENGDGSLLPIVIQKRTVPPCGVKDKTMLSRKKLGFNETRELKALTGKIEKLEAEQKAIHAQLADVEFYKRPPQEIAQAKARLDELEIELLAVYTRWEYLNNFN